VHELAVEEVVASRGWVGAVVVEAPARLSFGIGAYDGYGEVRGLVFEVADKVYALGKGAEEAYTWGKWVNLYLVGEGLRDVPM